MQQSRRCWPIGQPEKTTRVEAFAYPIPHPGDKIMFTTDNTEGYTTAELAALNAELAIRLSAIADTDATMTNEAFTVYSTHRTLEDAGKACQIESHGKMRRVLDGKGRDVTGAAVNAANA
jgi:hypothetical protein